jgi:AraC family transcriptional regulator
MSRTHSDEALSERAARTQASIDVDCAWPEGSVHLRTVRSNVACVRKLVREDLAIGICFQTPGSSVQWHLDGKPALDKTWGGAGGTHDLVVLPPGQEFVGRCRGHGQGLWLFIDPRSIDHDASLRQFAMRGTTDCSWSKDRLCWTIASELRNECTNGFPRGTMFAASASIAFLAQLAYVLDKTTPRAEPLQGLGRAKLGRILEYMESNLDHNLTLAELAALVDLTPRYFCEVFKRAVGRPPHQFQLEQRIERAKTLLRTDEVPLSDIALMVGFSSQSHLNMYFRRIVGVTPARYRAELLGQRS